ncbi:MAG TPA: DUF3109 family protein [Bacteroidota bacterium]|nr:DUF3109 family protein [Bacteroidota bacterium]
MFIIDEIEVDERIESVRFLCDLEKCKGACCTSPGGRGAPLTDEEQAEIVRAYPRILKYLPEEHKTAIRLFGLTEGRPGNLATPCLNNAACVFVHYVEGIARCAFETAFLAGEIAWPKPISCHLFPIRVHPSGKKIYYEFFEECRPALHLGSQEDARLEDVLRTPLERAFGKTWTGELGAVLKTKGSDTE